MKETMVAAVGYRCLLPPSLLPLARYGRLTTNHLPLRRRLFRFDSASPHAVYADYHQWLVVLPVH